MSGDGFRLSFGWRRSEAGRQPTGSTWGDASIIEPETTVYGDLRSLGTIEIRGTVEGNVFGDHLTVGPTGLVNGALFGLTVRIEGALVGRVEANEVQIGSTARIRGNICHFALEIEDGAQIEGLRPWRPARSFEEIIGAGVA